MVLPTAEVGNKMQSLIRNRFGYYYYFIFLLFTEQLWLFNGQVDDSPAGDFFHPLNITQHGYHPSLTTRGRERVYVLEVRIEPGDLNP